jgi:hypothetical protein
MDAADRAAGSGWLSQKALSIISHRRHEERRVVLMILLNFSFLGLGLLLLHGQELLTRELTVPNHPECCFATSGLFAGGQQSSA